MRTALIKISSFNKKNSLLLLNIPIQSLAAFEENISVLWTEQVGSKTFHAKLFEKMLQ
jgi:hypothetical protein